MMEALSTKAGQSKAGQSSVFREMNAAYNKVFKPNQLSVGLVVPIENYASTSTPQMKQHLQRVQLAESMGFSAVWLRDVPFNVPSFGDAGQLFDPFVYLGALATQTSDIALGVASLILPLRHPAHVAKAAASVDVLSNGRLLLGVASGDRPAEYPAMGVPFENRGALFRQSYETIRALAERPSRLAQNANNPWDTLDLLPKPVAGAIPMLITGSSQQDDAWVAANGNGWMTYPRDAQTQQQLIQNYRTKVAANGQPDKPVMEPLYVDLLDDPDALPVPVHLGLRLGVNALREYLRSRRRIGVNHVALNLRLNRAGTEKAIDVIAEQVLPEFNC